MFRATESGRGGSRWHRFARLCREFLTGVGEGFAAAERYQRLVRMSDGELAHMGLRRSDVAWYAVFGERRPVEREVAMARPEQGDLQARRRVDDQGSALEPA